ncbi:MAG: carbohydrate kinase family protein [Spirochaetes bacterium]|nr:carbohydrate kinase family protein [Spirochaetota bacterium]
MAGAKEPTEANLGGPSIVSLVHAAQLLDRRAFRVAFYGHRGRDADGEKIAGILSHVPVDASRYMTMEGRTPFTIVLSDPQYNAGQGERIFINNIGTELEFGPESIDDSFFEAEIVAFGGTALVPRIHDSLRKLASRARREGAIVVVNTVYDFRNQSRNPRLRWPLGDSDETYANIDLLVTDKEEALRLSGKTSVPKALAFFRTLGTGAAVITDGINDVSFYSNGDLFQKMTLGTLPISAAVMNDLSRKSGDRGDTTGCGDNFIGGLIASLAEQVCGGTRRGRFDFIDALILAIASGGFARFYVGGTFLESCPGEKRKNVDYYTGLYKRQLECSGKLKVPSGQLTVRER